MQDEHVLNTIPVGPLGLIPIDGCQELGRKVDAYLAAWRCERQHEHKGSVLFSEYEKESFKWIYIYDRVFARRYIYIR